MGHWKDFLEELFIIEAKYWQYFKKTGLSDHYILNEDENQSLRFGFKNDSELPPKIKKECLELFKKYQSNQWMA